MDNRRAFLLILSLAAFLTRAYTENTVSNLQDVSRIQDDAVPKDYRLPTTMHPTAYKITVTPTLSGKFEFVGEAKINIIVDSGTKSIVLHSGNINIIKVSVTVQGKLVKHQQPHYDKETEKYTIDLYETLNAGDLVVLDFEYTGHLRDDMIGFYKSSYINSDNTIRWLATTQFQTTHARHAFPCFDEPALKAKFTIRIIRPEKYTAISNMVLEKSEKISNDVYIDTFKESVPMSTYLVAFAVFDFKFSETGSVKVWSRSSAHEQTSYALKIGNTTLGQLGIFFDQEYQLEKMDMVAVPDFSAGAMENWGMITYRESRMLYDEKESNVVAQQNVASVIVHEIAHMWFGNLLTPSWWSYLWLSEGFARYFQYFGTAMIETSWSMEGQFLVEQHQAALAVDAIETSKSLSRDVKTPSDISTIGDSITYSKGASIIRMMSHIVGAAKFQQALQAYIRDNKGEGKGKGVVEPTNLWMAFRSVNPHKIIIESVMNTWTKQPGFPVLSVKIDKGKVSLRQERFLLRNMKSTPVNTIYHVPITYTTNSDVDFKSIEVNHWMIGEQYSFDVDISDTDWIMFNVQQTGFYRVNYDHDLWYRIIDTLNSASFEKIHVYNRAGVIDDLLNLARAGLLDYTTAIDGLQYLQREKYYLPFKAAFRAFDYLTQRFSGDEFNYTLYKNYVLSLIKNVYKDLGYVDQSNDDRLTIQLRRELNDLACKFGHEKCIATSLRLFNRWSKDKVYRIEPNQRSAAYCTGILHGNLEQWNHLWDHYKTSNVASEQSVVLNALGCSTNTDILERYLHYAISPYEKNRIRKQDSQTVFSSVYSASLIGASFVLDFVDKNHVKMAEYYGGYGAVGSILSGASRYLSTEELVDKFERLIKNHPEFSEIRQSLDSSLELVKYELNWYKKNVEEIVASIKRKLPGNEETTIYRLPENVIPKKYILSLEPFLEPDNFTFNGHVQIIAKVVKSTNEIVLHASDIVYHSVQVFVNNNLVNVTPSSVEKYDFLVIKLEKSLDANTEITIGIQFTGQLNKDMRGFYRSSYIDEDDRKRWLAATHLEPVGARKMFPCFDEPAMKAVFAVNVIIPETYHAISNTKAIEIEYIPETYKSWYRFEDTDVMSTYLLALVISDFEYQNQTVAGKEYSVWARPGTSNETSYALSLMEPLVNTYEKLLKHSYTLKKLDMIALPDFVSGAMENWGFLTFKEPNLLWHPNLSDTRSKQKVTNVISHEIAHQWFGDLVTLSWWKYTWLNEGFARYFQYFATSHIKDTWELESQFIVDQLHSAFETDALASSHPMTHDVYSPAEISGMFDTISYAKAASVIRMIEKSFGTDVFYTALQQYLEARKFKVASPEDLYAALADQITDQKLKDKLDKILDSWTTQAGYPVVNVELSKYTGSIFFYQERFLLRNEEKESVNEIWYIPITWTTESNPNFEITKPQFWLTSVSDSVERSSTEKWIIVNVQQAGYYRVNYDKTTWKNIIDVLKSPKFNTIHPVNRAALIDDLMNLARAGYVDYQLVFEAMEYLEREQHYLPWRAFLNGLEYLDRKFEGQQIYKYFIQHIRKIMTPIVRKLIDRNDISDVNTLHTTHLLKMHLHEWSCKYYIGDCVSNPKLTKPDRQPARYCKMAENEDNWIVLWSVYKRIEDITSRKQIILKALGCGTSEKYLTKLLEAAIREDYIIRYQDSTGVFASVYESNVAGPQFVMKFMKSNLRKMLDYYDDYSKIKTIMRGLAKRISKVEQHTQYKELSDTIVRNVPALKESLKSYNDLIIYEHDWYKKNIPLISYWLEKRYRVEDYRLPTELHPVYYNLTIDLEDNKNFFDASVKIDIAVVEPTFRIVLNSHDLTIQKINVYETPDASSVKEAKEFKVLGFNHISESQKLVIYLDSYINVSYISVEITYMGNINTRQQGLYNGEYKESGQIVYNYLATYFRPNYARMVFPCFDEPNFKAKFKLQIKHGNNVKTLSNMPLENTLYGISYKLDIYKETPIMSTYLLAFVVSDFNPIRNEKEMFNVWGMRHLVEHGSAVQYAAFKYYESLKSLVTIEGNFLEKVDLLALPNFHASAAENWGLFTFQDAALFYEEKVIPLSQKYSILTNVAKQIAHTYFGNLVTCEWWSYAWLNEGLPQYFQWLLYEKGMNEPYFSDYFVVNDMHDVMELDSTIFSHPLDYKASSPVTFKRAFDKISSKKAASIMRMFHLTFGGTVFHFGLEKYILDNQYSTVTPNKLWEALETKLNNVSVASIMSPWVTDTGYPLVRVSRNRTSGIIKLTQVRTTDQVTTKCKFNIPITVASELDPNFEVTAPQFWLTEREETFDTNLRDHWFVLNVQQAGYYRVQYDEWSLRKIIDVLNSDDYQLIHVINRAQIIDDLFHLAFIYEASYSYLFEAALYLRREYENLPWRAFERGINHLWENMNLKEQRDIEIFQKYVTYLTEEHVNNLGFDDAQDDTNPWPVAIRRNQLNRELILSLYCKFENKSCIEEATKLSEKGTRYRDISANAKPAILCTFVKHGGIRGWASVWEAYLDARLSSEQLIYLDALGCTQDKNHITTYLNFIFEKNRFSKIRKEDIPRALASIYKSSKTGWHLCYKYMIDNHVAIHNLLEDWDQVADIFIEIVLRIPNNKIADEFNFFLKNNHKNLAPIADELSDALYKARLTIKSASTLTWNIIYNMERILKEAGVYKPNTSTIWSANILLVALMSILPFLLVR